MQYRKLGRTGFEVSSLGFGGMRISAMSAKAIHYAIDHGVNYIDTGYSYQDGLNEVLIGKIIKPVYYRDKVKIATKMPCWLVHSPEDFDKYLEEQLRKMQTDYFDFYLLHALHKERWRKMDRYKVLDWAQRVARQGKIGHFGFSFHDSFEVFKEIIDAYEHWDLCYIQYNYMNEKVQAGKEGLQYASSRGLGVVIMEPLLGGALANPPASVNEVFERSGMDPVELALRWLWDQPEISCVLSGMTTIEQTTQNASIADHYGVGNLSMSERQLIKTAKLLYDKINPITCTKCKYCMPCPSGVNIPINLELYSEAINYGKLELNKEFYNYHVPDANKASSCINCKQCEEKCPQKIKISDWMHKIHKELSF
jgi:predicted aldo/keto reductase-like oxidoreductase